MKLSVEMPWCKDLSVNAYRFGRPAPGQKFRRRKPHVQGWMERLAWEVATDVSFPLFRAAIWRAGRAFVTVDFRFPDKRRRDDHNYFFVIANSVAAGLGIDDKDIRISTGSVMVDRENAGFTITIEDGGESATRMEP